MSVKGISFYDFLGKLIPGTLLLGLIVPESRVDSITPFTYVFLISIGYIGGIVYDMSVRWITGCLRRNTYMLAKAKENHLKNSGKQITVNDTVDRNSILEQYDRDYATLMKENMLGTVPVQEDHENFLRNIWFIIIIYFIVFLHACPCEEIGVCSTWF